MAASAWTTQIDKVINRMEGDATRSGLKAGAEFLKKKIEDRLAQGYTTGAFVTGRLAKVAVQRSRPGRDRIAVFTANPVAIVWELGAFNIYTQRFERVEVWRPTAEQYAQQIGEEFARRYLEKLNELAHTKLAPALA